MSDDEDDDCSIAISKYPVMPSLVALQQMKNRLHLARMGKKLMKWRAMATGRAMRQLAFELNQTYAHYKEDVAAAFIALARARFHNENLNNIVLNNIANRASVTIQVGIRNVAGVKMLEHNIVEDNTSPYMFLGIEKGGQAIDEAKRAWLNLLRCMIALVQERSGFMDLDVAHKNATKRAQTIKKSDIPRIKLTIRYIIFELEEQSREDFYRLKLIKKRKMLKRKRDSLISNKDLSQICDEDWSEEYLDEPCEPCKPCELCEPSEVCNEQFSKPYPYSEPLNECTYESLKELCDKLTNESLNATLNESSEACKACCQEQNSEPLNVLPLNDVLRESSEACKECCKKEDSAPKPDIDCLNALLNKSSNKFASVAVDGPIPDSYRNESLKEILSDVFNESSEACKVHSEPSSYTTSMVEEESLKKLSDIISLCMRLKSTTCVTICDNIEGESPAKYNILCREVPEDMKTKLEDLKTHLSKVICIAEDFKKVYSILLSAEKINSSCVEEDKHINLQHVPVGIKEEVSEKNIQDLKNN